MKITSIDVGYHNLGLVKAFIDDTYEITVEQIFTVDLPKLPHRQIKRQDCQLNHTSELADLMAHFIQEFGHLLDEADKILIERQPPTGLTSIETLLFYLYRNKTELISPNSMHKHFMIGQLEYEKRKERTVEFSSQLLENFEFYKELERKHDIADAVCMIIFYNSTNKEKYRLEHIDKSISFDQFRYNGRHNI
jgi:hypothetical protein